MIQREHYLAQIRPHYDSNLVKVITGIRYAGKSVLLEQIRDELTAAGRHVVSLDFDDPAVRSAIPDAMNLLDFFCTKGHPKRKHGKRCLILDGVQNFPQWIAVCRLLLLSDVSLFLADSGAPFLSPELARTLSGHCVVFHVRPFAYNELAACAFTRRRRISVEDYLLYGGFPGRLECPDTPARLRYLSDLDAAILSDVTTRFQIRKTEAFRALADQILRSGAQDCSASALRRQLQSQGIDASLNTIRQHLDYLEKAHVIRRIPRFSARANRRPGQHATLCAEDAAFYTIRQPRGQYDLPFLLENAVYQQLVYLGFTLSRYAFHNRGTAFLAAKDGQAYLMQAAVSLAEKGEREKAFRRLNSLDTSRRKYIISNDEDDYSTSAVGHIRLKDFLTMEEWRG